MRIGDAVRLKPGSALRGRLAPFADEVGEVVDTFQDDDDGLYIAVAYPDQLYGWLTPLSADDFVLDGDRPAAPY